MPETAITALVKLRRQLMSTVKLIELQLEAFMPVCRKCFWDKGLTDRCECNKRA